MPPLDLFIIASVVGAAAFFFAGLLLRPRRRLPALEAPSAEPSVGPLREQLASELMDARSQRAAAEQNLAEVRTEQQRLEEEKRRETEKFILSERERERLQAELEQRKRETDRFIASERERERLQAELEERKRETDKFIATEHERERLKTELEVRKRETERFVLSGRERDRLLAQLEDERKRDTEKYHADQRELDLLRSELEKLKQQEQAVQERLRVAEGENRAAFEREERASVAFHQRLASLANERQQQEASLRKQLDELRAQLAQQTSESERLQQERQALAGRESAMRHEVERVLAMRQSAAQEIARAQEAARAAELHERQALEQATEEQKRLLASLQATQKREVVLQARLAQMEVDSRAKGNAEESSRAQQARWQAEMDKLSREIADRQTEAAQLREQNQTLALAAGTSHDELIKARAEAHKLGESLRAAEARLAEKELLAQEIVELRAEHAQAQQSQQDQQGEAKDAKVQLAAAQAKLAELAQVLDENRRLRDQVEELRANQNASEELERLAAEHKRLRLDAELMARRLQELLQDQGEITTLRTQAADAMSLYEEVNYLRRREKELEAQLYSCGFRISRDMPAVAEVPSPQSPMGTMESNLQSLVGAAGARTAVLADIQGFLIASVGESWVEEGLAAFAAVAADMVTRTRSLLPLSQVESVRVIDANRTVLTCRLFESDGQGLGVATLGSDEPPVENTSQAVASLAAIISSKPDE